MKYSALSPSISTKISFRRRAISISVFSSSSDRSISKKRARQATFSYDARPAVPQVDGIAFTQRPPDLEINEKEHPASMMAQDALGGSPQFI